MENTNSFHFKPCNNSDELLIIFSSRNALRFDCFKLLDDYPINQLFVRDKTNSWYQKPVSDHWQNINEMMDLIRTVSDRFDPSKITCMGGSMGGYASIVTATKLRFSKALAFAPQMVLDHRLPNNPSSDVIPLYSDCYELVKHSPNTQVKIYSGTEDFSDLLNIFPVTYNETIDVSFVYGASHTIMKFLGRNQLAEIVISFVEGRKSTSVFPQINFLAHHDMYRCVCSFVRGFYFDNADLLTLNSMLEELFKYFPSWSAVHHYRGQSYAKYIKYDKAIESFEEAISFDKADHEIFNNLGLVLIQAGEYKKAEIAFRKANDFFPSPIPKYTYRIGTALMLQGLNDEAIVTQQRVLEINPNYSPAYYQLGLLMTKTGSYEEAILLFERALKLGNKNPNLQKHLATARKAMLTKPCVD